MILGIIAEDLSDVAVMRKLTAKVLPESAFSIKHFVGNGCGKLRRKCAAWADALRRRGCSHIVVVHDLDEADETELRLLLERAISSVRVQGSIIVIPVREIEAWLLSDSRAIQRVFNMQREPRVPRNPESVRDPKATLERLVWTAGKKRYVNSIHNERIAGEARLQSLHQCRSFRPYPDFLRRSAESGRSGATGDRR